MNSGNSAALKEEGDNAIRPFANRFHGVVALSRICPGCGGEVDEQGNAVLGALAPRHPVARMAPRGNGRHRQEAAVEKRAAQDPFEGEAKALDLYGTAFELIVAVGSVLGLIALGWAWYDIMSR